MHVFLLESVHLFSPELNAESAQKALRAPLEEVTCVLAKCCFRGSYTRRSPASSRAGVLDCLLVRIVYFSWWGARAGLEVWVKLLKCTEMCCKEPAAARGESVVNVRSECSAKIDEW